MYFFKLLNDFIMTNYYLTILYIEGWKIKNFLQGVTIFVLGVIAPILPTLLAGGVLIYFNTFFGGMAAKERFKRGEQKPNEPEFSWRQAFYMSTSKLLLFCLFITALVSFEYYLGVMIKEVSGLFLESHLLTTSGGVWLVFGQAMSIMKNYQYIGNNGIYTFLMTIVPAPLKKFTKQ